MFVWRKTLSGLLALFQLAVMYPNTIADNEIQIPLLALVVLFSTAPFLLILIFSGKHKLIEGIGWAAQVLIMALIFSW